VAAVLPLQLIPASRAAQVLHSLFPHDSVHVDAQANAVLVVAPQSDVDAMRTVVQGIDIRNPTRPTVQVVQLKVLKPADIIARLHPLYPSASFEKASKASVLVRATSGDMTEITALISSLDTQVATPAPTAVPVNAVAVKETSPRIVARAVAHQFPHLRVSISGSSIVLEGDPDQVTKAQALVASLDAPSFGARVTQIYHLHNVDASSVANLIQRSYPNLTISVDSDLNAISVRTTAGEQARIGDAIAQLDGAAANGVNGTAGSSEAAYGTSNIEVVHLRAAIPGQNDSPSTSAQDIATAVTQALGQMASDLHITVPANSSEIVLAGSPGSIHLAKDLIDKLDVAPPLVVLDTEVFEVDEDDARNLGLELPNAVISTTFSEVSPPPNPLTGLPGQITQLQPVTRTPLQLTAELNLLVSKGNARVLANPRVTTLSGHTATIRSGDTLAILTTTGGGVGTPVTQQLQTFNTGVTLDITPMVSDENDLIVSLHPVVNSLEGTLNGVPEISTRDTQTVVHLRDNQTLVIGGLIQEQISTQVTSIPLLGQIPLVGRLFRNDNTSTTSNELVIVVTPHVLQTGESPPPTPFPPPMSQPLPTAPPLQGLLTPQPNGALPTLPPMRRYSKNQQAAGPVLNTPPPSPTPMPIAQPSAFADANIFEYGQAPQNAYAGPSDTPQIFYARFGPTLVKNGTPITVQVITTTNVTHVP